MADLVRRTHVYVQRPREYEISGCPTCGNADPEWSEFAHHLWCGPCQRDFIPEHMGIFGGPIPVDCAKMLGIDLRRVNIGTGEIIEPGC